MQSSKPTIRIAAIQPCSLLTVGLVSSPSWAHPGHGVGGGDWTVLHYLTEPDQDLVDFLLTLYVNAGKGPCIRDGVDAPIAWSSKVFPYMAPPNPVRPSRLTSDENPLV